MEDEETRVTDFASLISNIYSSILFLDIPEDAFRIGILDQDNQGALDSNSYNKFYVDLLRKTYNIPHILESWSEDGIREQGDDLLLNLAHIKKRGVSTPDFNVIARNWVNEFDTPFQEVRCYSIVSGLTLDSSLELGAVTFFPGNAPLPDLESELAKSFRERLRPFRDSISSSKVTADWRRASEIHRQKTEYALNVLRFLAALVWHDQPARHVYVESEYPKRISDTIIISDGNTVYIDGGSDFFRLPITLNCETLPYAQSYGLVDLQNILRNPSQTELQRSFLAAIQWFGQATQELLPLTAFIKYYIPIEIILKKENESAMKVIPKRLGILIEPWDKLRLKKLETDLKSFIAERNSIFHSGTTLSKSPESLVWESRILSRQVLHQLRLRLESEGWQTKDDLISWVNSQYYKIRP